MGQGVGPRRKQELNDGGMAAMCGVQQGGRMPCPGVGPGFEKVLDPLEVPIPRGVREGPG